MLAAIAKVSLYHVRTIVNGDVDFADTNVLQLVNNPLQKRLAIYRQHGLGDAICQGTQTCSESPRHDDPL